MDNATARLDLELEQLREQAEQEYQAAKHDPTVDRGPVAMLGFNPWA